MKFTVLLEQLVTSDGHITHPGRLLAGELRLLQAHGDGDPLPATERRRGLLQPQGESVVRSFLRTPWMPRRSRRASACASIRSWATAPCTPASISARRRHADPGRRRRQGGDGGLQRRLRQLREAASTPRVATGYAHMSRLGPGIKPGVAVRQGQVIGFVGSTGMSTGPHLHYEFYRGGRAGQSAGAEVRHAGGGRRQGCGALQGPGQPVSRATEERAESGGQQARGQERRSRPADCERRLRQRKGRSKRPFLLQVGANVSPRLRSARARRPRSARRSRRSTSTVSPSWIRPSSSSVASGFCRLRWITRFSGRAP